MKILIIGNGLIASAIVQKLELEGHEILIFSRNFNKEIKSQQVSGDIFDFERFTDVLKWNPQVIINTAWITTPGLYRNDISNFAYSQFTSNLAKFIAHSSVQHLIVLGTCAEYGRQIEPCLSGVTRKIPSSLYAKQKVDAYENANRILQETAVRFTWARIFYPYGPKQDSRRLIPNLIHGLKSGEQIKLKDISSVYDWISSRDIAEAIYWAITHELPVEIDIGTSVGFTNLQVLAVLKELLNTTNRDESKCEHEYGHNEMFVVSPESPILRSGWAPRDSLYSGLDWAMHS